MSRFGTLSTGTDGLEPHLACMDVLLMLFYPHSIYLGKERGHLLFKLDAVALPGPAELARGWSA